MHITGKMRDYYDTARGYGVDKSVVYVRTTEDIQIKTALSPEYLRFNESLSPVEKGYIGFCGIIYGFYSFTNSDYSKDYVYTFKDLQVELKARKMKLSPWKYSGLTAADAQKHLNPVTNYSLFFDIGHPVFAVFPEGRRKEIVRANPLLKDYQFYKVFDPFFAFQELHMFIGGVLGEAHPPMAQVSDEVMKVKKGFGHKYAFKKEPKKGR
jgi:hypothetical protein